MQFVYLPHCRRTRLKVMLHGTILAQLNSIIPQGKVWGYPYQTLNRILGKGPFFLLAQKFLTNSLWTLWRVKTFKRSAAKQDISFYHNFDILLYFRL